MSEAYHKKYRPRLFSEVLGQGPVVKSIEQILKRGTSQSFLLCGPSGCGKTTLARITAKAAGCLPSAITEIDAATNTGVDDVRAVLEGLKYKPFGKSSARAVIIDECHSLSKNAWQALLKSVEEPPPHLFWFFCTTEAGKVPQTIKTRCSAFTLKPVSAQKLEELVDMVTEAEELELAQGVGDLIIKEAGGSPRQLLVNLALCAEAKNRKEAAAILQSAQETDGVIELCRFLMKGGNWSKAMAIVKKLDDVDPESVRIIVMNYMSKVAIGARDDRSAMVALNIMDNFSTPYNRSEQMAPLILSIAGVLMGDE